MFLVVYVLIFGIIFLCFLVILVKWGCLIICKILNGYVVLYGIVVIFFEKFV